MSKEKKHGEKASLHSRNRNRERYDLDALMMAIPKLKDYVKPNKFGLDSVDFSNPIAVKILNQALLKHYYGIKYWEFSDENLCPPIPGRADYIHQIADLLGHNFESIPIGNKITCLDVGIGASCIYPIIGVTEYGWAFVGSDIDPISIASANNIINANPTLIDKIQCRLQENPRAIFKGILDQDDLIDITICNPPFHASIEDAQKGTRRKIKNLSNKNVKIPKLNFAGNSNELVFEGGEFQFISTMIRDSKKVFKNCYWFSTLVSKQANLAGIYELLEKVDAKQVKTIPMETGNKSSRIVAWTFLSEREQNDWRETRWK